MSSFDIKDASLLTEQSCIEYRELAIFLKKDDYLTRKGSKYTNITDQGKFENYCIPFLGETRPDGEFVEFQRELEIAQGSLLDNENEESEENKLHNDKRDVKINQFFTLLEKCRIKNKFPLHYSERQYFTVSQNMKHLYNKKVEPADAPDDEKVNNPNDITIDHSCIEFDFDFYLENEVQFDEQKVYHPLTCDICKIIYEVIDPTTCKTHNKNIVDKDNDGKITWKFFIAIMSKPPQSITHSKWGSCWKNGFHMRFFIKVKKEVKQYIRSQILKRGILQARFNKLKIKNSWDDIFDPQSCSFPSMIYGSMKREGKMPHKLIKLYEVINETGTGMPILVSSSVFEPKITKTELISGVGRSIVKKTEDKIEYEYNLCQELSLNYEVPGGFIKKKMFEPRREIETEISRDMQLLDKNVIIAIQDDELEARVGSIIVHDFSARWIRDILSLLKPERLENYDQWTRIIRAIARESQEFIDIAIWISRRAVTKFKEGKDIAKIKALFNEARKDPNSGAETGKLVTFRTVEFWAKEDNPQQFNFIADHNAYNILKKYIFQYGGSLEHDHIATALSKMFAHKYRTSSKDSGKVADRKCWREFMFPSDVSEYNEGVAYKWRKVVGTEIISLNKFIKDKIPVMLKAIIENIDNLINEKSENENLDENWLKKVSKIKSNILSTAKKCANEGFVNGIISACFTRFHVDGFENKMDKNNPNHIGVMNGVLELYPTLRLIRSYHSLAISRFMSASYKPYDPEDPIIKSMETEFKRIFYNDEDAYSFTMMFLASQLDYVSKQPILFIWLGPGSNGKSIITELHLATFGPSLASGTGYGGKISIVWFSQDSTTTCDANVGVFEYARSIIAAEQNQNSVPLNMGRVKEVLSETVSGNDKNEKQIFYRYPGNFVYVSNWAPQITNNDHGTWRRIRVYNFKMIFAKPGDPKYNANDPHCYLENPEIQKWSNLPEYRNAYLSILTKWYKIYAEKYNRDLNLIPIPTIIKETTEYRISQDKLSQFINSYVIKIGQFYPDTTIAVPPINMEAVAGRYIQWLTKQIDSRHKQTTSGVIKQFSESIDLGGYIHAVQGSKSMFLHEHHLLRDGETIEQARRPTDQQIKEAQQTQDKKEITDFEQEIESNLKNSEEPKEKSKEEPKEKPKEVKEEPKNPKNTNETPKDEPKEKQKEKNDKNPSIQEDNILSIDEELESILNDIV